jgi:hypothetical protein
MKLDTEQIIESLRAAACENEKIMDLAADRLEELQRLNDSMQVDRDLWIKVGREKLQAAEKERDEALAEVEQLKAYPTRPEPSRLEIAAMFFQGMRASGCIWGDPEKVALEDADKLIKRAQEVK